MSRFLKNSNNFELVKQRLRIVEILPTKQRIYIRNKCVTEKLPTASLKARISLKASQRFCQRFFSYASEVCNMLYTNVRNLAWSSSVLHDFVWRWDEISNSGNKGCKKVLNFYFQFLNFKSYQILLISFIYFFFSNDLMVLH